MERLTIAEAAKRLDLTQEAVRARIRRGTIESEKEEDGKTYVFVPETDDRSNTFANPVVNDYINTLKSEVEAWKEVARTRDEELKRKDHLLAIALERIPAIEAPQPDQSAASDAREFVVSDSETEAKGSVRQEPAEDEIQRSWWRRFFGG